MAGYVGRVAEWLGTALQKLLLRFESARDLEQPMPRDPGHRLVQGIVQPTGPVPYKKGASFTLVGCT